MDLIKTMRKQKAVYWARLDPDHYGEFSFAEPVEIDCRWEDVSAEYKPRGAGPGEVSMSEATVYVDRDMKEGDYLRLGPLPAQADPREDEAARPIVRFERLPTLDAKHFLLTARL